VDVTEVDSDQQGSFLRGVRIVEVADELGEYAGKVLAGLGAEVIKVEPPGGEITRTYGPFAGDESHPDRSLYFWHYNFGKKSLVLDLDHPDGQQKFRDLVSAADGVLDTRPRGYLDARGVGWDALSSDQPSLVYARICPFGDDGPWVGYLGSDLVHLALGGVMSNCGYDPEPGGKYDTPPIAPQMWQAYQIAGENMAIHFIAALMYKNAHGTGQLLSLAVHEAVAKNTETDTPNWIYARRPHKRLTCRHSFAQVDASDQSGETTPGISATKDGRWVLPYRTYLPGYGTLDQVVEVLRKYDMQDDLDDARYSDPDYIKRPETVRHLNAVVDRFVRSYKYDRDVWKDGQDVGLAWAPVRRPEENTTEEHWLRRETFLDVRYPELGRTYRQIGAKWLAPGLPWRSGPRAPLVGEHTAELLSELGSRTAAPGPRASAPVAATGKAQAPARTSVHGKPFALNGVRVVDLAWLLASGGAGRFLASMGAEVIKVEHVSKVDTMRLGTAQVPVGGRAERDSATRPLAAPATRGLNGSGNFLDINAGKRSLSLNIKSAQGKDLLRRLIAEADIVIEGFSPGTMDRLGLGYDTLREINPRIVYVQQSGMGQIGTYGRLRSFGPTGAAFSGLSDMSGLPDPYPPAGIGYSYLDWFGAYQMALAMVAGLYLARQTGEGCWIDSSQAETGMYLTGTAVLDHEVNGRAWARYGNRSPYKPAAPSGAYPAAGDDRWLAISAFTEQQWHDLARTLASEEWTWDPRLATLALRLQNQDYLDAKISEVTAKWDAYELMHALQAAGIPAGVVQTAQDRCESDPQLAHLGWLVELNQTDAGRWPVRETSVRMSATPPYIGGPLDRHGPSYGEDNDYVLRAILNLGDEDIARLTEAGVI
jgi:crotonobetainyl-CoA:carnitine CoA-transferase CaiB-like acyl-CoA transferase